MFEAIITHITPDLYGSRRAAVLDQREAAMTSKIRCRVNGEDVREATNLFREESESRQPRQTWSYLSQAKCWFEWVLVEVVDYLPTSRR